MNPPQSPPEFFDYYLRRGELNEARKLLDQYPNLFETFDVVTGDTPMHTLVELCITSRCEWALENGAHIDVVNRDGMTPLHAGANMDDGDMVDFLLSKGATLEAQDNSGCTPLLYACNMGCEMAMEHLILAGADTTARDKRDMGLLGVFLQSNYYHDWDQAVATAGWLEDYYTRPEFISDALEQIERVKQQGTQGNGYAWFPLLVASIQAADLGNTTQPTSEPAAPRARF